MLETLVVVVVRDGELVVVLRVTDGVVDVRGAVKLRDDDGILNERDELNPPRLEVLEKPPRAQTPVGSNANPISTAA